MYIGNTVQNQGFTPQVDFFSGNASTTAFTLSRPVASVYQMVVVVANVIQNPGSAYTVSSNTITFSSAPPTGTNNIWVEYTSLITQVIAPSPGTVGTSQLQSNLTLGGTTTASTITSAASTNLSLQTNNGTTAVTIDTNQNVGVGVTPNAWGGATAGKTIQVGTTGAFVATNGGSTNMFYNSYYNGTNYIYQTTDYAQRFSVQGNLFVWQQAVTGTAGGTISYTNTMTLDASGCLFVGGTSSVNSQYKIQVQNANAVIYRTDGSRCILSFQQTGGTAQTWNTQLKTDSSQNWYMIANPSETVGVYMTPSASGWNNLSDERAKENWVELTNALENVNTLRAGTHSWVKDKTLPRDVGLIAQDILKVLPEAVDTSDPDNFGVRYTHVIPILVKAIQELSAQVTALQTKVGV